MAFSAEQRPISKLLNDCILEIPRNQRHYVWKKDNWQYLFSIGCIVLKKEDSINGLN